ncbi:MAG: glycoside hydrolase family 5 protein [Pseudomonadota bacterium]
MASRLIFPLLLLVAMVCLPGCDTPASPQETVEPARTVPPSPIQRCMNLSNALEAPNEGDWGYSVRAQDILTIADAGFDTLRLPVKVSAHTGPGPDYKISEQLLARIDTLVGQALAADLNIILDVHHFNEIYADPDGETPRLKAIWRQLGQRYAGAPDHLIFELLNEPRDDLTVRRMDALNRELLALVRETNPQRWVILSSSGWGGLDAWREADFPSELRVMSTFHYYEPYDFTHQGAVWLESPPTYPGEWGDDPAEIAEIRAHFALARQKAISDGLPVFLGEFGTNGSIPIEQRTAWIDTVRRAAEGSGFSWCHWGFAAGLGAYDPEAEAWRPGMLEAFGLISERAAP